MKKNRIIGKVLTYAALLVLSGIMLLPFVYMVSISLASDHTNNISAFTLFPREFEFSNYVSVLTNSKTPLWLKNSLIITGFNTLFQVFSNALVAYAFARLRARWKHPLFIILLSTMMIPSQVTLIPQFVMFRHMGWINSFLPLIIPNVFGSAYYIFMLRQFIMRLPISLDEAAKIDGLGYLGIFGKVIIPLIKPAMAAVAILAILGNWNWFFEPMIYLNDQSKYPLAIGVQIMSATSGFGQMPLWNRVFAASMILVVPMVIIYFAGQKFMFELNINAGSDSLK